LGVDGLQLGLPAAEGDANGVGEDAHSGSANANSGVKRKSTRTKQPRRRLGKTRIVLDQRSPQKLLGLVPSVLN
jgi:hypothetical protein